MVIKIDDEKVKKIADYYGWNSQLRQLAEECCELSVEALHYTRERGATERISEEIVDVLIMIQQIIYLLKNDTEKLEKYADFKLDRQLGRIEREQKQIIRICIESVFVVNKNINIKRVMSYLKSMIKKRVDLRYKYMNRERVC